MAPPRSLLLVYGSGSGPWIFEGWTAAFPGVTVDAVDLHAGLDVRRASHADYAEAVARAAAELPRPLALCGWSMGGLVVLPGGRAGAAGLRGRDPGPSAPCRGPGDPSPETGGRRRQLRPGGPLPGRPFLPGREPAGPPRVLARPRGSASAGSPSVSPPVPVARRLLGRRVPGRARHAGRGALRIGTALALPPASTTGTSCSTKRVPRAVARWLGIAASEAGRVHAP